MNSTQILFLLFFVMVVQIIITIYFLIRFIKLILIKNIVILVNRLGQNLMSIQHYELNKSFVVLYERLYRGLCSLFILLFTLVWLDGITNFGLFQIPYPFMEMGLFLYIPALLFTKELSKWTVGEQTFVKILGFYKIINYVIRPLVVIYSSYLAVVSYCLCYELFLNNIYRKLYAIYYEALYNLEIEYKILCWTDLLQYDFFFFTWFIIKVILFFLLIGIMLSSQLQSFFAKKTKDAFSIFYAFGFNLIELMFHLIPYCYGLSWWLFIFYIIDIIDCPILNLGWQFQVFHLISFLIVTFQFIIPYRNSLKSLSPVIAKDFVNKYLFTKYGFSFRFFLVGTITFSFPLQFYGGIFYIYLSHVDWYLFTNFHCFLLNILILVPFIYTIILAFSIDLFKLLFFTFGKNNLTNESYSDSLYYYCKIVVLKYYYYNITNYNNNIIPFARTSTLHRWYNSSYDEFVFMENELSFIYQKLVCHLDQEFLSFLYDVACVSITQEFIYLKSTGNCCNLSYFYERSTMLQLTYNFDASKTCNLLLQKNYYNVFVQKHLDELSYIKSITTSNRYR